MQQMGGDGHISHYFTCKVRRRNIFIFWTPKFKIPTVTATVRYTHRKSFRCEFSKLVCNSKLTTAKDAKWKIDNVPYSTGSHLKHFPIHARHVRLHRKFHVLFRSARHSRNPKKRHSFSVCSNLNRLVPTNSTVFPFYLLFSSLLSSGNRSMVGTIASSINYQVFRLNCD